MSFRLLSYLIQSLVYISILIRLLFHMMFLLFLFTYDVNGYSYLCKDALPKSFFINSKYFRHASISFLWWLVTIDRSCLSRAIKVAPGWGPEESCPSIPHCQGLQPSTLEASAWREGVGRAPRRPSPVTHSWPLELSPVPRSRELLREAAGKRGLGLAKAPSSLPSLHQGWDRQHESPAGALRCHQREAKVKRHASWGWLRAERSTGTRWGNCVLVKEGMCQGHTVRWE